MTFENDEGKDFAVKFFKDNKKSQDALFRSTHRLKVSRAMEPDDVFFENLEKTPVEIFFGRVSSFVIIAVVFIVALTINFAIKLEVKALRPNSSSCDDAVDYTREDKNCYCNQNGFSDISYCSDIVAGGERRGGGELVVGLKRDGSGFSEVLFANPSRNSSSSLSPSQHSSRTLRPSSRQQ